MVLRIGITLMAAYVAQTRETRNAYIILKGGKQLIGRIKQDLKMSFKENGLDNVDLTELV
jgi:hypothetical protein